MTRERMIELEVPEDQLDTVVYKGAGCDICGGSGHKGRVAFYEVLYMNEEMKECVLQGYSTAELKAEAIRLGMNTLRRAAVLKMLEGVTSPEEVVRNTAPDHH